MLNNLRLLLVAKKWLVEDSTNIPLVEKGRLEVGEVSARYTIMESTGTLDESC